MQKNTNLFLALIMLLAVFTVGCSSEPNTPSNSKTEYDFGDGYKLYDLIPFFVTYAETGTSKNQTERLNLWNTMLENKFPDFFNQVIYRNLQGTAKDSLKNYIIAIFWQRIVPQQLNTLRMLDQVAAKKIIDSRNSFKQILSDFNLGCNYYQTISFDFSGKSLLLNDKTILAIGLENFISGDIQLDFTIAREQFYIYHRKKGFSADGALFKGIWEEGMAARAQVEVFTGNYTYGQVLNFSQPKIDDILSKWDTLVKKLQYNLLSSADSVKTAFLKDTDNNLAIPPRCGYFIGLRVIMTLIDKGNKFSDMAGWNADTVLAKMQEVLPTLKPE